MPLLYKSKVPYADHAINHTVGCAHNCSYCYARDQIAIPFKHVKDEAEWRDDYRLKQDVVLTLDRELRKLQERGTLDGIKSVHLCFTGDPFPYDLWRKEAFRIREATLDIIGQLVRNGLKVIVLTKGILPPPRLLSALDLLGHGVEWGITLVSLDEHFRDLHEPGSAPLASRIWALKQLALLHEETWVSVEPLPTPDIHPVAVNRLFHEVFFVKRLVLGRWNYAGKWKEWADWYRAQVDVVYDLCMANGVRFEVKDILGEKLKVMIP